MDRDHLQTAMRLKALGHPVRLGIVLRHRFAMVIVFFAVLGGTVYMYDVVPKPPSRVTLRNSCP